MSAQGCASASVVETSSIKFLLPNVARTGMPREFAGRTANRERVPTPSPWKIGAPTTSLSQMQRRSARSDVPASPLETPPCRHAPDPVLPSPIYEEGSEKEDEEVVASGCHDRRKVDVFLEFEEGVKRGDLKEAEQEAVKPRALWMAALREHERAASFAVAAANSVDCRWGEVSRSTCQSLLVGGGQRGGVPQAYASEAPAVPRNFGRRPIVRVTSVFTEISMRFGDRLATTPQPAAVMVSASPIPRRTRAQSLF